MKSWIYTNSNGIEHIIQAPDMVRAQQAIEETEAENGEAAGLIAANSVREHCPYEEDGQPCNKEYGLDCLHGL